MTSYALEVSWLLYAIGMLFAVVFVTIAQNLFGRSEARLIEHCKGDYTNLGLDVEFVKDFRYWKHGTVETTYYALEILSYLDNKKAMELGQKCEDFIWASFNSQKGGWTSTRSKVLNMHSTHCALGALKVMYGRPSAQPIEKRAEFISDATIKSIEKTTLEFFDRDLQQTYISEVYSANTVRWNLGLRFDDVRKTAIASYVDSLKRTDGGYALRSLDAEACISACFFATRLMGHLGEKYLEMIDRKSVERFIRSNRRENNLYSGRPYLRGNILHTRMAIELCRKLNLDCSIDWDGIFNTILGMTTPRGVPFAPELQPNIIALNSFLKILVDYGAMLSDDPSNRSELAVEALEKFNLDVHSVVDLIESHYFNDVQFSLLSNPAFRGYANRPISDYVL